MSAPERRAPRAFRSPEAPGWGMPQSRTAAPFPEAGGRIGPARSGGLLKSPFPLAPDAPARPRLPLRPPEEDDLFAEPEEYLPPPRRDDFGEGGSLPRRRGPLRRRGEGVPAEQPDTRRGKRPHPVRALVLKSLAAFVLLASCSSAAFAGAHLYHLYSFAQNITNKALPTLTLPSSTRVPQATALSGNLSSVSAFNLLLLGSDNDTKFKTGAVLTQTDIVVHVDLANHKVAMVSIPRDLWVESDYGVCCHKLDEISGAETDGATDPLQAKLHGFAHTAATIEADFGIPINAYAWVGLDGFVKVIDTLGGVDVDVLHPVVDDAYPKDVNNEDDPYAYQRLYIPAGPQHLDGATALEYVRSRHSDLTGDFGRSQRQQSVLVALKKKLNNPAILGQLDELANDLQGSVLTSLTIPQIVWLANWARGLKNTDITQLVLSEPTYGYGAVVSGKDVIQPNWPAINQTVRQIFPDAVASVNLSKPQATDAQTIQTEGARVLVENGSGVTGVAAKLASILKNDGFKVVGAQDANRIYLATQVDQYNAKTAGTAGILSQMLGVPIQTPEIAGPSGTDIVIIIGKDIANAIQAYSG
jgi:LCP family protein required for cell wall assembly